MPRFVCLCAALHVQQEQGAPAALQKATKRRSKKRKRGAAGTKGEDTLLMGWYHKQSSDCVYIVSRQRLNVMCQGND